MLSLEPIGAEGDQGAMEHGLAEGEHPLGGGRVENEVLKGPEGEIVFVLDNGEVAVSLGGVPPDELVREFEVLLF